MNGRRLGQDTLCRRMNMVRERRIRLQMGLGSRRRLKRRREIVLLNLAMAAVKQWLVFRSFIYELASTRTINSENHSDGFSYQGRSAVVYAATNSFRVSDL